MILSMCLYKQGPVDYNIIFKWDDHDQWGGKRQVAYSFSLIHKFDVLLMSF